MHSKMMMSLTLSSSPPLSSLSLSLSPPPSQELLYTHNAYPIISKNPALLRKMLSNVWNQLITMEDVKGLYGNSVL